MHIDRLGRAYDPKARSRAGTIGAHALHANHDSRKVTEAARRNGPNTVGWHMKKLAERQPDWDSLSPHEQHKRATHEMKRYFASLPKRKAS